MGSRGDFRRPRRDVRELGSKEPLAKEPLAKEPLPASRAWVQRLPGARV
jgi:hypothetical protein